MNLTRSFSFETPTRIEYGPGMFSNLALELSRLGARRVLVVTDKGVRGALSDWAVLDPLREAGIEATVFDEVEPNPKDRNVTAWLSRWKGPHARQSRQLSLFAETSAYRL